jgi:ABC-type multidrug transport system fused ATPase/permease subunit
VDGSEISKPRALKLRDRLSCQQQDPFFYFGTAKSVVLDANTGKEDDPDRFKLALQVSGWEETASKLLKGLPFKEGAALLDRLDDIKIGRYFHLPEDKPVGISGGELKTMNTAQVLYREADMYWLDEPDAALDAAREVEFRERLRDIKDGRTYVITSHRLSIAAYVDRIIYLREGRVLEDGTPAELMARKGAFYAAFMKQYEPYRMVAESHAQFFKATQN